MESKASALGFLKPFPDGHYLFFDELQNINSWAPQLKYLVDLN
ncbi:hypothetical protein QUF54_07420 [Candidatus Marithioploca araucensis]|uniref:AAA domain-containing protein n=1 Tax=Candidatus Marithioploca araucensis TaxID=70273 RepID=A0ABT7VUD4_9GAMM|nr:hypothetical protein [Candidatus Marithioploca araucensis]